MDVTPPQGYQFPFFRIHEVVVASRGVSLSTDLLEELCTRGLRLSLLDSTGKPYAMLTSPMLSATVQARREQILAFNDTRGLAFARTGVGGSLLWLTQGRRAVSPTHRPADGRA